MQSALNSLNASNTPQQFTGVTTFFRTMTAFGISGFTSSGTPINNNATINYGFVSGQLPMSVVPGASANYNVYSVQERKNLQELWLVGKQNDALYVIWD